MIIHSELKGYLAAFLTNIGFLVSFAVLLLVAMYEEKFDDMLSAHSV